MRVYLSSTYKDLKDYRRDVADGLRQANHTAVGMEDYVAEGSRPLAKCVRDVAESDVYVGIFAWRYGYIPQEPANPDGLSITELEFQTALTELGRDRCLIFILDPAAPWSPDLMDSTTGENQGGGRIRDFKSRLGTDFLVSTFKTPQELARLVTTAVANLPPPPERHARELNFDTVLAFADPTDMPLAQAVSEGLTALDPSFVARLVPRALFAESQVEFRDLEREVIQSHSAVLLITPTLLGLLKALPDQGHRAVQVLYQRTGAAMAVLQGVTSADLPNGWPPVTVLPAGPQIADTCLTIKTAIDARCPTRGQPTVGLPYIVLSVTDKEAADLFQGRDPGSVDARFKALLPGLSREGDPVARYGPERRDWKPFGDKTAESIAGEIAARLNEPTSALGQRFVKLQYYSFDLWLTKDDTLSWIYRELRATGCVAVVDQVSLFHSGVCDAIATFLERSADQVAVVATSPPESLTAAEVQLIERQARERLAGVFSRFDADLDPACEFGVAEERRLRRWLRSSVPATVSKLAELRPDENRISRFRKGAPERRTGAAKLLWPSRAR